MDKNMHCQNPQLLFDAPLINTMISSYNTKEACEKIKLWYEKVFGLPIVEDKTIRLFIEENSSKEKGMITDAVDVVNINIPSLLKRIVKEGAKIIVTTKFGAYIVFIPKDIQNKLLEKYRIATNPTEWYVFDEKGFDRLFDVFQLIKILFRNSECSSITKSYLPGWRLLLDRIEERLAEAEEELSTRFWWKAFYLGEVIFANQGYVVTKYQDEFFYLYLDEAGEPKVLKMDSINCAISLLFWVDNEKF